MMKKIALVAWLILMHLTALAQPTDSVDMKLKAYTKEDSVKVEMLIDAGVNTTFKSDDRLLLWATQAKEMAERIHYPLGKIRALNSIGNYYYQRGSFDKSMSYYLEALKLAETRKDTRNIIISKSNVANVFTHLKRHQEAIIMFKECDQLLAAGKDSLTQNRAAILTNLATAYSVANKHDSAIFRYRQVYRICKKLSIVFGVAIAQANLANEYLGIKEYKKALESLKEADQLVQKHGLSYFESDVSKCYGKVYIALGDLPKGIHYIQQSVLIAQKNKDLNGLNNSYASLHKAYAQAHDFARAYETAAKAIVINDSLQGVQKHKTVQELNTKYETEKKESQIKALQQEKAIAELTSERKSFAIYLMISVLLLAGSLGYFFFERYKHRKESQAWATQLRYEQNLNKSVLTSIKAQMNPHFFYNALNTIQSYIFSDDKRNATTYLNKFSNLTRMILEMSEKDRVPLRQEIRALTLYLELEKSRFHENFSFQLNVDDQIDQEMVSIPTMLIQPYVENAIKHGLLHKTDNRELMIDIKQSEQTLQVSIDDNGVGRAQSAEYNKQRPDKPESFSSQANQIRLDILNNGRQSKVGVQFIDKHNEHQAPAGTTVIISIPLVA
jgi:two-component system LytT family sensor kinase